MPARIKQHKPPRSAVAAAPEANRQRTRYLHTGSKAWRAIRAVQLGRFPLCEDCQAAGLLTVATEVDHNTDDTARNRIGVELSSLCKPCHSSRTRRRQNEKSRGTGDQWHARPALHAPPRIGLVKK